MAEMESGMLARQSLDLRIPKTALLKCYGAVWQSRRNRAEVKIDGLFTTADAHINLKRLYPSIHAGSQLVLLVIDCDRVIAIRHHSLIESIGTAIVVCSAPAAHMPSRIWSNE